ncbi:MAG: hypothetical protein K2Q19_01275 [Rhodocyclaceae bacterium]|jgi:uncharacterized membrane protein|nr:hypothetical protein [Rhodocyclaceae bacterium]
MSDKPDTLRTIVIAGYALQAAGFITGGLGNLVAVVLAYVKRDDARGTQYEEHLRWQINTFWGALAGAILGWVTAIILIGFAIFFATTIWLIYRIIKGWLALHEGKPVYPITSRS